jgi:Nif-specific regulatory protein
MPSFLVREPFRLALSLPLEGALSIGRHEDNQLRLPYAEVSRHHARIEEEQGGFRVHDLGSRTGTFVNGVRMPGAALREGDTVRIGPALLTFTAAEPRAIELTALCPTADEGALSNEDPRLRLLFEISRTAFAEADPDELLVRLLDAVIRILRVERAIAALREDDEPERFRHICRTREGAPAGELSLSLAAMEALSSRRSVLLRDDSVARFSAMGAPLQIGARALGFLYVEDRARRARFHQDDLDFMNAIACLTAAAIDSAERYQRAAAAAEAAAGGFAAFSEIVGESAAIRRMKEQIHRYAAAPTTTVLIHGESGTGKELVARAIHAASPRASRPFIAINCAAIPDAMIEGELFGYERGAFTGAHRSRKGRFVLAHRGTLFLDEIGDLSPQAQAKVLRVTQDGEVYPLGAEQPVRVDVRILAATHRDLRAEVAAGRFREDLYFRLKVVEVEVPPLRERVEDVPLLAQQFLEAMALNLGKRVRGFSASARVALTNHPWPGNVRELKNEIERALLHADGAVVEVEDLGPSLFPFGDLGDASGARQSPRKDPSSKEQSQPLSRRYAALDEMERALVEEALAAARGNLAEAARMLGITRIMLRRRVERYGLRAREV